MNTLKTKLTSLISGDTRVIWQKDEIYGGYEDFPTKLQAQKFINQLQNESK